LAKGAAVVVCDRGYLQHQRRWRDRVADEARCAVVQVEGDVVVPVEDVSDHHEFAARTIRPKIHRLWAQYLKPLKPAPIEHSSLRLRIDGGDIDVADPTAALAKL